MNSFFANGLAWMLTELILTGILLCMYHVLCRLNWSSEDKYRFLKLGFCFVVFLPWIPFSWLNFFPKEAVSTSKSIVSVAATMIQPVHEVGHVVSEKILAIIATFYASVVMIALLRLVVSLIKLRMLANRSKFMFEFRGIDVRSTNDDIPPATFGLFDPIILIPNTVRESLSPIELEMILEHEKRHIDRHDYFFNLVKSFVSALLVFSPFIHRLAKFFSEEMELSCDAFVVKSKRYKSKEYGSLLLRLATDTSPRRDLVYSGLFVSNSFISRRILAMKKMNTGSKKLWSLAAFAVFALIVAPGISSLGIQAAVDQALPSQKISNGENAFTYQAFAVTGSGKKASVSGSANLGDGEKAEASLGIMHLSMLSKKHSNGWEMTVELSNERSKEVLQRSIVVFDDSGVEIAFKDDHAKKDDDLSKFNMNIRPVLSHEKAASKNTAEFNGEMVTLNFYEPTEIREVIKTMAQVTGKNIILNRDVNAKIQMTSPKPISKQEAYKSFLVALDLAGLTAEEQAKFIRIGLRPSSSN